MSKAEDLPFPVALFELKTRPWRRLTTFSCILLGVLAVFLPLRIGRDGALSTGHIAHREIRTTVQDFLNDPIDPLKDAGFIKGKFVSGAFVKVADRLLEVQRWHDRAASMRGFWQWHSKSWLNAQVDRVLSHTLPFLSMTEESTQAFSNIRDHHQPGTEGLVIPMHRGSFRYGAHLLANLKRLNNTLPIEIAYAGDGDLALSYRNAIRKIHAGAQAPLRFLNILRVLDDDSIELTIGGWAVKAFAVLASRFEKVLLLDADAFFFLPPQVLSDHVSKHESLGAFLFHDKLLWKDVYEEKLEWYRSLFELRNKEKPSPALANSRVYNEGYSEEADSGFVYLDKSYSAVMFGLLHICWQNSKTVRDELTYRITHGDKESWWIGLELLRAPYSFNEGYAVALGEHVSDDDNNGICGKAIVHAWGGEADLTYVSDDNGRAVVVSNANNTTSPKRGKRLFWLNGSIITDKHEQPSDYNVPNMWAYDGVWRERQKEGVPICMEKTEMRLISGQEYRILSQGVEDAMDLNDEYWQLMGLK